MLDIRAFGAVLKASSDMKDIRIYDIDYRRKPSANIGLKGYTLDLSPGLERPSVPVRCGLFISGTDGVSYRNINLNGCEIIG